MSLIERVREQANDVMGRAQNRLRNGQALIEQVQARRRAEAVLRDLGAAVYAMRRGESDRGIEIERLVAALREHEETYGDLDLSPTADRAGDDGDLDLDAV